MGAPVIISRMDHTPAELRVLAVKSDNADNARRLLAIAMVLEGSSRLDAARQTGMDRQTLRDWVHRYNTSGVTGLVSRKPPGAAPKLTEAQMAELREVVIAGPDPKPYGHTVALHRSVCGGDKALHGHGAGTHDGQARAHAPAAPPVSPKEKCRHAGGI
jgi:transposase-like protein